MQFRWIVVSLSLAVTGRVHADDDLARMNEVMLSNAGDPTQQFVEIENPAGESLPADNYSLFVHGADGTQEIFQPLPSAKQPGVQRITIATTSARAALGLTETSVPPFQVVNLPNPLPAAGTACFRRTDDGVSEDLHCMRWGGATAPATAPLNGLVTGPAPGDSMSLQRQPTCAAVGAPTANAVNATIPCPPPMGDAGVGGDGGTTNPGSDDDGCSVGASPGGFALVGMTALVLFGVRRRRR